MMLTKKPPRRLGKSIVRVRTLCPYIPAHTYLVVDIWYNKWAGGDREDNYSKCVFPCSGLAPVQG